MSVAAVRRVSLRPGTLSELLIACASSGQDLVPNKIARNIFVLNKLAFRALWASLFAEGAGVLMTGSMPMLLRGGIEVPV